MANTEQASRGRTFSLRDYADSSHPGPADPSVKIPTGLIDCQSHLFCPDLVARMEQRSEDPRVYTRDGIRWLQMGDWMRKILPHYTRIERKLATMDAHHIAQTALSINDPGPEWFGAEGPAVARVANDYVADVVRQYPTRFFGICVLPWQDVTAATQELNRCAHELGMKGLLLYSNLAGRFPDEAEFRPVLARAAELAMPVLLHPAMPVTTKVVRDYEMTSSLGNMFENTIALTRIVMSGMLDELPDLKLVCPHLGGTLPYMVGRIDHQVLVLKRGPRTLQRAPSEYLKQIWYDIISPLPLAMKFMLEFVGPDRLLYASDHPWVEPDVIRDAFLSLDVPHDQQTKIFSGNALRLFNLS